MENKMTNHKNNYRNLIEIKECKLCGISTDEIPKRFLHVDHIYEESYNFTKSENLKSQKSDINHQINDRKNLQVLCKHCHMEKTRLSKAGDIELFNYLLKGTNQNQELKKQIRSTSLEWIKNQPEYRSKTKKNNIQLHFEDLK
tara:strand:- start:74 stop:502 length:429 start_codon:yes stop_codon:yes gene_type:complete